MERSARRLLENLNSGKRGLLGEYLKSIKNEPRIAWYPSSGEDFRAPMYLNAEYEKINPSKEDIPAPPDFFLFTDYFPWSGSVFLDSEEIYNDRHTHITVEAIEELPSLNLPKHPEIILVSDRLSVSSILSDRNAVYNRCIFMKIKIESDKLGTIRCPVLYAFVENEAFFIEKLLPLMSKITHVIHVRYGGGCGGGGYASGIWLVSVLKKLGTELFVTDDHHFWQSGDEAFLKLCPVIKKDDEPELTKIKTIPSVKWSDYGDVNFYKVRPNST